MKKAKTKSYLHTYYCSDHVTSRPMRIVLSKSGQPEVKTGKNKKGMHALGSN